MKMWEEYEICGKNVLITGASSGIGKKITGFLLKKECNVIIVSSDEKKLKNTFYELKNDKLKYFVCDITDDFQLNELVNFVKKIKLNVLINCAAILGPLGKFGDSDFERWKRTIEVNLIGNAHVIQKLLPLLIKGKNPKIINLGGGGAANSRPFHTAYASSKTAMVRLTEIIADEYKGMIDINIIAPGVHNTAMIEQETYDPKPDKWADDDRLSSLICFLISSKSNGVTGRFIHIENNWKDFTKEISETERFQLRRTN